MSIEPIIALFTLTTLEIILGIDNIVFITILVGRLPKAQREKARIIGLSLAMISRVLLLLVINWIIGLKADLFQLSDLAIPGTYGETGISGKDLILIGGGLFLIGKSTHEIHENLEGDAHEEESGSKPVGFMGVLVQIALIDIVFSLDSVITAVGMSEDLWVMITAVIVAIGVMMVAAGPIGRYVESHPTLKMLGLSFLILIGVALLGEGLDLEIPKGYIYFSMAFAVVVEMLNLQVRKSKPVALGRRMSRAESVAEAHDAAAGETSHA